MVPDNWEKHPVGKLCKSIVPGRNKPKTFGGDIPWVTTPEISGRYLPSFKQKNYISKTVASECGAKIIPAGAVVIAAVGELGLTAIATEEVALNQQLHAFICPDFVDNEYLAYFLSIQKPYMDTVASKTTIPYMNKGNCESIPILLPPLPEQRKIAKILSTWDKAIATTEKLIAASKQQKKALMQQLLTGKKRLVNPETGRVFEGEWEEVLLGDICHVNPKKPNEPSNGLVSFISMDAVSEEAQLLRADVKNYSQVSKGFTGFANGDTLVAKITPCFENGKGAKVSGLENGIGFGSTEFHVLRAKKGICPDFIYFLTITSSFRVRGEMNMQGSAGQKRVTTDYLRLYKVVVPSDFKQQQKIAQVLATADQEIEHLESKLAHFQQEKKALMQQLLTGKRRVKVDSEVEAV